MSVNPSVSKFAKRAFWIFAVIFFGFGAIATYLAESEKYANDQTVARDFMGSWSQQGYGAVSALDPNSPQAAKEMLGTIHIKSFDGALTDVGDSEITVFATGTQYPVHDFRVVPVIDLAGLYYPLPMTISVSKETHKVFCVKPDEIK
jgi:uncharacterized membrane protein